LPNSLLHRAASDSDHALTQRLPNGEISDDSDYIIGSGEDIPKPIPAKRRETKPSPKAKVKTKRKIDEVVKKAKPTSSKRRVTPYGLFTKTNRSAMKQMHPDKSAKEITALLKEEFGNITNDEMNVFIGNDRICRLKLMPSMKKARVQTVISCMAVFCVT
jgi:3-methyladenine DNA glycosylase/8-oxoguanine DNA glycosylase